MWLFISVPNLVLALCNNQLSETKCNCKNNQDNCSDIKIRSVHCVKSTYKKTVHMSSPFRYTDILYCKITNEMKFSIAEWIKYVLTVQHFVCFHLLPVQMLDEKDIKAQFYGVSISNYKLYEYTVIIIK
jgi:hypothetical protein